MFNWGIALSVIQWGFGITLSVAGVILSMCIGHVLCGNKNNSGLAEMFFGATALVIIMAFWAGIGAFA